MDDTSAYKLEFESLTTAVSQEVLDNYGNLVLRINEKTFVTFIITQHELAKTQDEFKRKLKSLDAEFDESFMEKLFRLISDMHPEYKHIVERTLNASTTVPANGGRRGEGRRAPREPTQVPYDSATQNQSLGRSGGRNRWARGAGRRKSVEAVSEPVPQPRAIVTESTSGPTLAGASAPVHRRSLRDRMAAPNNHTPNQAEPDEHNNTRDLRLSNQSQHSWSGHDDIATIPPNDRFVVADAAVPTVLEPPERPGRLNANPNHNPITQRGDIERQSATTMEPPEAFSPSTGPQRHNQTSSRVQGAQLEHTGAASSASHTAQNKVAPATAERLGVSVNPRNTGINASSTPQLGSVTNRSARNPVVANVVDTELLQSHGDTVDRRHPSRNATQSQRGQPRQSEVTTIQPRTYGSLEAARNLIPPTTGQLGSSARWGTDTSNQYSPRYTSKSSTNPTALVLTTPTRQRSKQGDPQLRLNPFTSVIESIIIDVGVVPNVTEEDQRARLVSMGQIKPLKVGWALWLKMGGGGDTGILAKRWFRTASTRVGARNQNLELLLSMDITNAYKLEFELLKSAVYDAVFKHSGSKDITSVSFIINQHESSTEEEFKRTLKRAGTGFDESFMGNLFSLILNMHPKYSRVGAGTPDASTTAAANGAGKGRRQRARRKPVQVSHKPATRNREPRRSNRRGGPTGDASGSNVAPKVAGEPAAKLGEVTKEPTSRTAMAKAKAPAHPKPLRSRQGTPNRMPGQPPPSKRNKARGPRQVSSQSFQVQTRRDATALTSPNVHALQDAAVPTAMEPSGSSTGLKLNPEDNLATQLRGIARQPANTAKPVETSPPKTHAQALSHRLPQPHRGESHRTSEENTQKVSHPNNDCIQDARLENTRTAPSVPHDIQNTVAPRLTTPTVAQQLRSSVIRNTSTSANPTSQLVDVHNQTTSNRDSATVVNPEPPQSLRGTVEYRSRQSQLSETDHTHAHTGQEYPGRNATHSQQTQSRHNEVITVPPQVCGTLEVAPNLIPVTTERPRSTAIWNADMNNKYSLQYESELEESEGNLSTTDEETADEDAADEDTATSTPPSDTHTPVLPSRPPTTIPSHTTMPTPNHTTATTSADPTALIPPAPASAEHLLASERSDTQWRLNPFTSASGKTVLGVAVAALAVGNAWMAVSRRRR
ncbi:hypothetical protein BDV93DRAFT_510551 [Ceratobasidium sp. AG-I]|nr:hypothetical protein BDV93DRAFT_510551 [Ceratobasidium sp. AG-I]